MRKLSVVLLLLASILLHASLADEGHNNNDHDHGGPHGPTRPLPVAPAYGEFIDVHHHHFTPYAAAYFKRTNPFLLVAPPTNASMQLTWMNANNVRTAILSYPLTDVANFSDPGYPLEVQNATWGQYEVVASNPLRFGSLGGIPLPNVQASLAAIDYGLSLPIPVDGFEVSSNANGSYVGDPAHAAVWSRLNELNALVFVHPTNPPVYPATGINPAFYEWMFDTTRAIFNIFETGCFVLYPNIRWMFAHTGGTWPYLSYRLSSHLTANSPTNGNGLNATEVKRILGNRTYEEIIATVFWDTTIANPGHFYELRDMGANMTNNLMVGSDYPWYTNVSNAAATSGLFNVEGVNRVRYGNALDQFPRLKAEYKRAGLI